MNESKGAADATKSTGTSLTQEQMLATLIRFDRALVDQNLAEMQAAVTPSFEWELPGETPISGVTTGPDQAIDRCRAIARFDVNSEFLSSKVTGPLSLEIVVRDTVNSNWKTFSLTTTDQATFSADGRLATLTGGWDQEQAKAFFR